MQRDSGIAIVRYSTETSPVVPVVIQGHTFKLLVDTGSRISLLRESMLSQIENGSNQILSPAKSKYYRFVGVTGHDIEVEGCFEMSISLGSFAFRHPFYVIADSQSLPVDGILVQDVLSSLKIDVLTTKGILKVENVDIPIVNWSNREVSDEQNEIRDETAVATVRLYAMCKVPPMS